MAGKIAEYSKLLEWDDSKTLSMISSFIEKGGKAKMGDFVNLFAGYLSRKQVRNFVDKLVNKGVLSYKGERNQRTYYLSEKYKKHKLT
ncbi:MAG TPA: hypothetical protein PL115_05310 [Bacteroidales bacterium]|jgi:DNA-binding transcriptional regulator PaaX|nr:hypothetical protein [Bacteroidales bacterium]HPB88761.1 hypothetical protein [Bacteroidales bacterium]HQA93521.1 hypothetical protein [Bacteroidales bacterium]HQN23612.1 hypothetical protein [Bacteroidales bacterium]HQP79263.1 hypothetical protein [Bacteroidales bacterium]